MKPSLENPVPPAGTLKGTPALSIDMASWGALYQNQEFSALNEQFLTGLKFFYENTFFGLTNRDKLSITRFLEGFLFYFTRPGFPLKTEEAAQFISYGCVISNLFRLSYFESADPWLKTLLYQKNSFEKILCLYSPRSSIKVDTAAWFEAAPIITSLWWCYYFNHASNFASKTVYENCLEHLEGLHDKFELFGVGAGEPYFPVTYLNPERDRVYKEKFNTLAAGSLGHLKVDGDPDPTRVAVISGAWIPGHAVYKCFQPLVEHLSTKYKLTLVHLGEPAEVDASLFEEVIPLQILDTRMELGSVLHGRFSAVFYPDIGMDLEGKYLSNIRLAPVQVAGYGHPVSTFGSAIDYFLGGRDVEEEEASKHYSERLVLIPGLGIHPVFPNIVRESSKRVPPAGKIRINCAWGNLKYNFPILEILKEILHRSKYQIIYQFLPGGSGLNIANNYQVFMEDLQELLGVENCEILIGQSYDGYLNCLNQGSFGVDSFPFCGFQSVLDNL
ncbi:hypothetical protein HOF92_14040, partial [bacterium]|nr:hypothetical protein [bacterium]